MGAVALAATLAGCSAMKLGYDTLAQVGYWWLDGYFSFGEQGEQVRDGIRKVHAWHRANELPRIAQLLARIERLAPGEISAAQACAFVPDFEARIESVVRQAQPFAAQAVLAFTPRQLRHLQRKYDDTNADWRSEWLEASSADVREKRLRQWLDRAESVYGRLEDAQRSVLKDAVERSVFDPQRVHAERLRRQQDLLEILRRAAGSQASVAEVQAAIGGYIERFMHSPDPAYRALQRASIDEQCRIVAALHASTTPAQRERAVRRLRGWQRDLLDLAAGQ